MATPFDAIVIGGGPAGALAARALARQGRRIALLEARPRYRDKSCGHCLNPRALAALADAGLLEPVRRLAAGPIERLRLHWPGRRPLILPLDAGSRRAGLVVARHDLDQLLIDAAAEAGAIVRQPARARVMKADACEARIAVSTSDGEEEITSGFVVGADGLRSQVARAFGIHARPGGRRGGKFGFSFDLPGPGPTQPGTIDMFVGRDGYLGLVRGRGNAAHVAGLASSRPDERGRTIDAFLHDMGDSFDTLRDLALPSRPARQRDHFAACGPMPCAPRRVAVAGVALVGDAAGYVEPFTGEGIAWAATAARLLGQSAANCPRGAWTHVAARRYERSWRREIGRGQRLCRLLAFLLERPDLAGVLRGLGSGWPGLGQRLAQRLAAT